MKYFISHTIGPADLHPSPAPQFRTSKHIKYYSQSGN